MVLNGAQFHMFVNHLPVIGFVVAVLALFAASLAKSVEVKRFVLSLTVVTGLSALPAMWTGEPAEEVIEHMSGVDEALIHEHEEAAEFATILSVITAIAAAGALMLHVRNPDSLRRTLPGVMMLSLLAAAALGKTAHEGGKIRHPEIRADQAKESTPASIDNDAKDD